MIKEMILKPNYRILFLSFILSVVGVPLQLWADHTGEVEVMISDDFENKTSKRDYYLKTQDGKHYALDFGKSQPPISSGDKITVRGRERKGVIAVPYSADKNSVQTLIALPSKPIMPVITRKEVAVILFNFLNDTSQPYTHDFLRESIFTGARSVNAFYKEQSFDKIYLEGKIRTDGDVFGPYTLNYNKISCGSQFMDWANAADGAAQAAGVDVAGYDHIVYIFPNSSDCGWLGKAQIPGKKSWINGFRGMFDGLATVVSHELGHNFGVDHANSYSCIDPNTNLAIAINPPSNCQSIEYRDIFSVMGKSNYFHMNAFHKERLGYFVSSNGIQNVLTFSTDDTYFIEPIEKASLGIQSIIIPRNLTTSDLATNNYYLEYRQPYGFDNFHVNDLAVNGLIIHAASSVSLMKKSYLIDTTPETPDVYDAPLLVGRNLYTHDGFKIKVLDKTSAGLMVRIDHINKPTAAVISNVRVNGITYNAATIAWETNEFSTSQVEYGLTTSYGNSTPLTPINYSGFLGGHTHTLSNLSRNTLYHFRVESRDPEGNLAASADFTFKTKQDTTPPTVSFTSPAAGAAISGHTPFSVIAYDDNALFSLRIQIDNDRSSLSSVSGRENWTYILNTLALSNGPHVITVEAMDFDGNSKTASITVTVDNAPPTVSFTSPADGATVSGNVTLSGTAADNHALSTVEIQIDEGAFNLASGLANWTYTLDTLALSNGYHVITVRATDAGGNSRTASIILLVNNIPQNLVINPGFESGTVNWFFYDLYASIDNVVFHSGSNSAKIIVHSRKASQILTNPSISAGIVPNSLYHVSFWTKFDNVSSGLRRRRDQARGVSASLGWYNSAGELIRRQVIVNSLLGTRNWVKINNYFISPPTATKARIFLQLNQGPSGTVWFDDIELILMGGTVEAFAAPALMSSNVRLSAGVLGNPNNPDLIIEEVAIDTIFADEGGEVLSIKNHKVMIPPKALSVDTDIFIASLEEPDPEEEVVREAERGRQNLKAASEPVEFGPHGTQFNAPVTLTLAYDPALLQESSAEYLRIAYWNEDTFAWELLPSVIDKENKKISAQTTHFSLYQVLAKPSSHKDSSFKVGSIYSFPNPAAGGYNPTIHVECGLADTVKVRIYNDIGEFIHEANLSEISGATDNAYFYEYVWDVSGVASGTYIYTVTAQKSGAADIKATHKLAVIK